jgi:uncharacterized protein YciI
MAIFAVIYRYVDDEQRVTQHRPAHRDYIRSLVGERGLIASGRMDGGEIPSALLLFSLDSKAAVEDVLNPDPFWELGLIETREIMEWTLASGSIGLDGES